MAEAETALPSWMSRAVIPTVGVEDEPAWARRAVRETVSTPEAAGRGLVSGATFGFWPTMAGGAASSSLMGGEAGVLPFGAGMSMEEAGKIGREITAAERRRQHAAREQHPYVFGTGEAVGSLASPVPGGALTAAGRSVGTRIAGGALQGAIGGGLAGAGEAETVEGMPGAAVTGAAGGALVGGPLGAVAPALTHFVTAPVRSLFRPGAQAERVLGETAARAERTPLRDPDGQPLRFVPGQPGVPPEAVVADYLGVPGQQVARWAKNTSPEAAATLQSTLAQRARGQGQRLRDWGQQRFGAITENELEQEALRAAAARENSPLYQLAMWHGNQLPYSPHIEALRGAPAVQEAMRGAEEAIQNRIIGQGGGAGPRRPANPNSLQYWDQVKRNLDKQIGQAERAGNMELVNELTPIKRRLVAALDEAVPSYAEARGSARLFFEQENALEAGAHAVNNNKLNWRQVDRSFREMSPQERELFQRAGRNEFLMKTENIADRADLWKRINQNENERRKLEVIFGTQGFRELEARQHAETIMQWTHDAVQGNSTTAQQYLTALALGSTGALGGAGAGGYTYGDVGGAIQGGIPGGLMLLHRGARMRGNQQVAERVAQMLVSRDPRSLDAVVAAARRNDSVMQSLRNILNAGIPRTAGAGMGRGEERQAQEGQQP